MFTTHRVLEASGRWALHSYKLERSLTPEAEMEEIREGLAIGLTIQGSYRESFASRTSREVRAEENVSGRLGDYISVAPGLRVLPEEYAFLPEPTVKPTCAMQERETRSIRSRMKKGLKKGTKKVSKKTKKAPAKKANPTPKQQQRRGPSPTSVARAQRVATAKAKAKTMFAMFVASRKQAEVKAEVKPVLNNGFTNPTGGTVNWDLIDSRSGPPMGETEAAVLFGEPPARGIVQPAPKNNKRKGA